MSEKATITVKELSSRMSISLPKAYELVSLPDFPSIKIGTRILIPVGAFNEWINNMGKQKRVMCEKGDKDYE